MKLPTRAIWGASLQASFTTCHLVKGEDLKLGMLATWTHDTFPMEGVLSTHGLPLFKLLLESF